MNPHHFALGLGGERCFRNSRSKNPAQFILRCRNMGRKRWSLYFLPFLAGLCVATPAEQPVFEPEGLTFDLPGVSTQCAQHWRDFTLQLATPSNLFSDVDSHWALKSMYVRIKEMDYNAYQIVSILA